MNGQYRHVISKHQKENLGDKNNSIFVWEDVRILGKGFLLEIIL